MLLPGSPFPSIEAHASDGWSSGGVQDYQRRLALLRISRYAGILAPAMLVMLSGKARALPAREIAPGETAPPTP
jgi:hypothetical protein